MIHRPHVDWFALAPVNALLLVTGIALLCAVLVPRAWRKPVVAASCAAGYAIAFGFAVALYVRSAHGHGIVADAIRRDRLPALATMIVAGALLLFGLAMMIAGLGFKASAAPFHMWTPDVYEGAPTPVTAFMSAATKTVALVVTLRILVTAFPTNEHLWTVAVAVIAVCSLVVGNFAALVQRTVKRMLAYSSISHAGFMLIAVAADSALGARALLYYLIPSPAMPLGSFPFVAARIRELGVPVTYENMAGFGWERPLLGISMWAFLLGFAGFPLTGGFVGKFYVFSAAYQHGWTWLVIVGVLATLVSLYYYLGLVRAMFMRRTEDLQLAPIGGSPPRDALLQSAVLACLVVTVGSFFAVQPLIDLAKHATHALPF